MIEDLTGNIKRVCEGLAAEVARRVSNDIPDCDAEKVRRHTLQVLLDWFLGEFIPRVPPPTSP